MKYLTIILLFLSLNSFAQSDTTSSSEYLIKSGDELIRYNQKVKNSIFLSALSIVLTITSVNSENKGVPPGQAFAILTGAGAVVVYFSAQKHIKRAGMYLKKAGLRHK